MVLPIAKAILAIKNGGVIVYPTETSYAFGCDARDSRAVRNILKLKGRAALKQLPVIASSLEMVEKFCVMNKLERKLAKKYWPGPLSLILETKRGLAVAKKGGFIAIRVSSHAVAAQLSKQLGSPIVSTSANKSAKPPCFSIAALKRQFGSRLPHDIVIIYVGVLPRRLPSTIAYVVNNKVLIKRQGSIYVDRTPNETIMQ